MVTVVMLFAGLTTNLWESIYDAVSFTGVFKKKGECDQARGGGGWYLEFQVTGMMK